MVIVIQTKDKQNAKRIIKAHHKEISAAEYDMITDALTSNHDGNTRIAFDEIESSINKMTPSQIKGLLRVMVYGAKRFWDQEVHIWKDGEYPPLDPDDTM